MTFILQEVIQMKNEIRQNSKEIKDFKMVVANLSARDSNRSDEMAKLHTELAVLKFTIENVQNGQSHSFNNGNYTEVMAKLHNLETAIRQFTFALNGKASKSEMSGIEQRLASLSNSVPQIISSHQASVDAQLKNITDRVHDLEYGEIIPGNGIII
jgi:chromosome segregation ATPase